MCVGGQPLPSTRELADSLQQEFDEGTAAVERGLDVWYHATYWPTIKAIMDFAALAQGYDESFVIEANTELRNDE
jgi:hypothetical protein